MGCGFVVVVAEEDAAAATELLARHHPGARRIGTVTADAGRVSAPGVEGDRTGLRATAPSSTA
jgi:phosphoribosylformylglycinamidine cyclo-ligase